MLKVNHTTKVLTFHGVLLSLAGLAYFGKHDWAHIMLAIIVGAVFFVTSVGITNEATLQRLATYPVRSRILRAITNISGATLVVLMVLDGDWLLALALALTIALNFRMHAAVDKIRNENDTPPGTV